MRQVTRFALALPPRLSERVLARFMEHSQCTDPPTAAVAAFVQILPFLLSMARSMAAFRLQDPAVMRYASGTVLLPHPSSSSNGAASDQDELMRGFEAMPVIDPTPEAAEPRAAIQDQGEPARGSEEMPVPDPAPEVAAQDQASTITDLGADPAASDAAQDEAEPRSLQPIHEILDAAQTLASMQLQEIVFNRPPPPSDGQPPAIFPQASGQFGLLPPPMINRNAPSPDRQSDKTHKSDSFPEATSAHELEQLRAQKLRARRATLPESDLSTRPYASIVPDDSPPESPPTEPRERTERLVSYLSRARTHEQTRTRGDRASWSRRAREVFDNWMLDEHQRAAERQRRERDWQRRHSLFLQSFYNRPSETDPKRRKQHPRRYSEPNPTANLKESAFRPKFNNSRYLRAQAKAPSEQHEPAASVASHEGDSESLIENVSRNRTPSPRKGNRRKNKKAKHGKPRNGPFKTKKALQEELQQRIAAQKQHEQEENEATDSTMNDDWSPERFEVLAKNLALFSGQVTDEPHASTSSKPQAAAPAGPGDHTIADDAASLQRIPQATAPEDRGDRTTADDAASLKAKEEADAKRKAKTKAKKEGRHRRKREEKDRKTAVALARQEAAQLGKETKLERQNEKRIELEKRMELQKQIELEKRIEPEKGVELEKQPELEKQIELEKISERSGAQGHSVRDNSNTSQREQFTGPEYRSPAADMQVEQRPDDTVLSRRSSDAQFSRLPQHATFLIPTDSSPRLPYQRSDSSGPSECSFDGFPEARQDQNAEIQHTAALRQQRIEFGVDGSSSVTTSPVRRISAVERDEPSEVTYPEPRQPDVPRESPIIEAAPELHSSDVQQQQRGDAIPPRQRQRVVFILGGDSSCSDTETSAEQQLTHDEEVAQREVARRVSLNLGEIDVPTDSYGNSAMTSNAPSSPAEQVWPGPVIALPYGEWRTVSSPLGRTTAPVDNVNGTTPEWPNRHWHYDNPLTSPPQPTPNGYPARSGLPNGVSSQHGLPDHSSQPASFDLADDRFHPDAASRPPQHDSPSTCDDRIIQRRIRNQRPRGWYRGLPPNRDGRQPTPNGYPEQHDLRDQIPRSAPFSPVGYRFPLTSDSRLSQDHLAVMVDGRTLERRPRDQQPTPNSYPAQHDLPDRSLRPVPFDPAAGSFIPDTAYAPLTRDDLPFIVDGRTPEQRRRDPLPDLLSLPPRMGPLYPAVHWITPGPDREYGGYGIMQATPQAPAMPSSMTTSAVPPLTAQRERRPTEHQLSLDPNTNVRGGDEHAIASSSCSDNKGDGNDADDESSGKDG